LSARKHTQRSQSSQEALSSINRNASAERIAPLLIVADVEQIRILGHDEPSTTCLGSRKKFVVFGIAADRGGLLGSTEVALAITSRMA
jgi:hypothetical protein